jgi:hypothetical protein
MVIVWFFPPFDMFFMFVFISLFSLPDDSGFSAHDAGLKTPR